MGRSERDLAIEAIGAACADAGLPVTAIDGLVSYHIEQVAEVDLVTTLGLPDLRFMARNRSKAASYGDNPNQGGRPWAKAGARRRDFRQWQHPFGIAAPAHEMA